MTVSIGNITGAAVVGLTTPGYTVTLDTAPDVNGKQWAITALTGTQTNVDVHAASKPFTVTFTKPKSYKALGSPNPVTGVISNVPMNQYQLLIRKGVVPLTGQSSRVAMCRIVFDVPAGSETQEPEDLAALVSAAAGALWANASGIADTIKSGVM